MKEDTDVFSIEGDAIAGFWRHLVLGALFCVILIILLNIKTLNLFILLMIPTSFYMTIYFMHSAYISRLQKVLVIDNTGLHVYYNNILRNEIKLSDISEIGTNNEFMDITSLSQLFPGYFYILTSKGGHIEFKEGVFMDNVENLIAAFRVLGSFVEEEKREVRIDDRLQWLKEVESEDEEDGKWEEDEDTLQYEEDHVDEDVEWLL